MLFLFLHVFQELLHAGGFHQIHLLPVASLLGQLMLQLSQQLSLWQEKGKEIEEGTVFPLSKRPGMRSFPKG